MKKPPSNMRLKIRFGPAAPFPARASICFQYIAGAQKGPARSIEVEAGRRGTWVLEFEPLQHLPEEAHLVFTKLEDLFRFGYRHQNYWPAAMNYITVEDEDGEALTFECDTCLKSSTWALLTLPRAFDCEKRIVVRFGDRRFGGPGCAVAARTYECVRVAAGVALNGDTSFRSTTNGTVCIRVAPCSPPVRYHVWCPSIIRPGEACRAIALSVDLNGNPIRGGGTLAIGGINAASPGKFGQREVDITLRKTGVTRLPLQDSDLGIRAFSNPIQVSMNSPYRVYWGEFHSHAYDASEINVLNENTHPERGFVYARDVARLDFLGISSHIFRNDPDAVHDWWPMAREAAAKCDAQGHFVSFMGCEWRDSEKKGGDRNLIWKELEAPMPDPRWSIGEMYAAPRSQTGMAIPHVGGIPALAFHHDPEKE